MKTPLSTCFSLLTIAGLMTVPCSADWTPPDDPDPQKILNGIREDVKERRYEDALAKHVWYHENALKHQPAQAGVRLSFALGYWEELGEVYPPALDELKRIRDETAKKVKAGSNLRQSFQDLAAINKTLGDEKRTTKAFVALEKRDPEAAEQVFSLAQPALIKSKEYATCGKYLEPKASIPRIIESYHRNRSLVTRFGEHHERFTEKSFTNAATTLVALLVVNDRQAEAQNAADKFREAWGNTEFLAALDKALEGEVPKPWP